MCDTRQDNDMVLFCSFDKGGAIDESGNKNNGQAVGATAAKGKIGRAMAFTGKGATAPDFFVDHDWTEDVPLFARAMVLARDTLFLAGPPDKLDEPDAFRRIEDPEVRLALAEQAAALDGEKGGLLLAVSTADGRELARHELGQIPVFDGMAAAYGRLYLSTAGGHVVCFGAD